MLSRICALPSYFLRSKANRFYDSSRGISRKREGGLFCFTLTKYFALCTFERSSVEWSTWTNTSQVHCVQSDFSGKTRNADVSTGALYGRALMRIGRVTTTSTCVSYATSILVWRFDGVSILQSTHFPRLVEISFI